MPSDAAVLNLDVLMRIADDHGGPEAIAELVRLFRRESTELFDRLGLALSAGDIDESERLCTELRGTVSSIGAERLAGLMSDVDRMIGDDRINDAVRSADRFWDELGLVLDELDRSLAWARSAAATTNTAHARGTVDSSTAQSAAEYSPTAAAPAAWPAPTVDSLVSVG